MTRLSLLCGLFLSATVTAMVFLLSLVAKVTLATLLYRVFVVFFIFALLGVLIGSFLEVLLMHITKTKETQHLEAERKLDHPHIIEALGDLLPNKPTAPPHTSSERSEKVTLQPITFPRVTVESTENEKVVEQGDSTALT